jgi:hypothetical protein
LPSGTVTLCGVLDLRVSLLLVVGIVVSLSMGLFGMVIAALPPRR